MTTEHTPNVAAVAKRNLRYFIGAASFKCEVDREAALNCLDTLEQEIGGLNDQVAVLQAYHAAEARLATHPTEPELIERIAKAIADAFDADAPDTTNLARAALAALQEIPSSTAIPIVPTKDEPCFTTGANDADASTPCGGFVAALMAEIDREMAIPTDIACAVFRAAKRAALKSTPTGENAELVERLRTLLWKAHDAFDRYAARHMQKGTPEGEEKARANAMLAEEIWTALTPRTKTERAALQATPSNHVEMGHG